MPYRLEEQGDLFGGFADFKVKRELLPGVVAFLTCPLLHGAHPVRQEELPEVTFTLDKRRCSCGRAQQLLILPEQPERWTDGWIKHLDQDRLLALFYATQAETEDRRKQFDELAQWKKRFRKIRREMTIRRRRDEKRKKEGLPPLYGL